MSQPEWECIANLGDADPITYGGLLVFIDKTGVYQPEAEFIEEYENDHYEEDFDPDEHGSDGYDEKKHEELNWNIYRIILEPCFYNPETDVLSDNPFHKDHAAWYATPESRRKERPQDTTYLQNICDTCDIEKEELIRLLCSEDAVERAQGYVLIALYHGWRELDPDALEIKSRKEMEERYREALASLKAIGRK